MTAQIRLQPGDHAPDFTLPNADEQPVSLADYRGRRVIVYFYPAAGTPGCTKQACDFQAASATIEAAGLTVLGISPDPPEKLREFRDQETLRFPLLSDPDRSVMTRWGAFGQKQMYGKTVTGVIRSTFVVGADGRIEEARYGVRATGHVAKLTRELGLAG
jgi:peroxiredoxin Q/BCP